MLDPSIKLRTFQTHVKTLQDIVTIENTGVHSVLPHVNSLLHSAILACKAASLSSTVFHSNEFEGENIAAGKNMEHQWRFKQTTKTPGRKKGNVLRLVLFYRCIITLCYCRHAGKEEKAIILAELASTEKKVKVKCNNYYSI